MSFQHKLLWIWLAIVTTVLLWAAILSEGAYGGADSFMHYLISRYSWQDPNLFLHHWGKPVFTILSSPFAQLGFIGVRIFNILCALAASFLTFRTSENLGIKYPILAAILTGVATLAPPVYLSGLTEPLFGLTLILAIYLASSSKLSWSALVISFIPLIRTEGIIFIPLWILVSGLIKSWKTIPLLFTGLMMFSLLGWFGGMNLFWLITESPYGTAASYGSGDLLHFWNYREETFGSIFIVLLFFGVGWLASQWRLFTSKSTVSFTWILILISFFGYFVAHSVVWWQGTGSSAGLTRVMIGIVPVGAVIASASTQATVFITKGRNIIAYTLAAFTVLYQGFYSFSGSSTLSIPSKWGPEETVLQVAVDYMRENNLDNNYVVYFNPVVAFMLELNPFKTEKSRQQIPDRSQPELYIPNGAILLYDNHFGPVEGELDQSTLDRSEYYELKRVFTTHENHFMLNGDRYLVYVYQKVR